MKFLNAVLSFVERSPNPRKRCRILGSHFCRSREHSQVVVEIYYSELSYRVSTEEEEYPLKEMMNEWMGIAGIYFGFSLLSLVGMINIAIVTYGRKSHIKEKIATKAKDLHKKFSEIKLSDIMAQRTMEIDTMPQK